MTDNDIIKAFEALAESKVGYIYQDVIDLLKRQKAEREALIAGQETLHKRIAEQKAEFERLKNNFAITVDVNDCLAVVEREMNAIKSEAIKEFAERLKDIFPALDALHTAIDIVMKEMEGDGNG